MPTRTIASKPSMSIFGEDTSRLDVVFFDGWQEDGESYGALILTPNNSVNTDVELAESITVHLETEDLIRLKYAIDMLFAARDEYYKKEAFPIG